MPDVEVNQRVWAFRRRFQVRITDVVMVGESGMPEKLAGFRLQTTAGKQHSRTCDLPEVPCRGLGTSSAKLLVSGTYLAVGYCSRRR